MSKNLCNIKATRKYALVTALATLQIFTAKLQPHYSQTAVSQIELQPLTVHSDWL